MTDDLQTDTPSEPDDGTGDPYADHPEAQYAPDSDPDANQPDDAPPEPDAETS